MALVLFTVVGLPSVSQSQVVRFPTAVRPGLADKAIISASIHMRFYLTDLDADSHDIRGQQARQALVYHADTDAAGQHLAKTLRAEDSAGIIYSSVGHTQGECVGVFRPVCCRTAVRSGISATFGMGSGFGMSMKRSHCRAARPRAMRLTATLSVVAFAIVGVGAVVAQTVTDGDTIKLGGATYRLWGIDAPKTHEVCADGGWRVSRLLGCLQNS